MRLLPSLLLAAFTGTVTANLDAVSSRLQVSIPADLYRDEVRKRKKRNIDGAQCVLEEGGERRENGQTRATLAWASNAQATELCRQRLLPLFTHSVCSLSHPPPLHHHKGYDHREALFGIPPYGGAISQQVYYSGTNGCEEELDPQKG